VKYSLETIYSLQICHKNRNIAKKQPFYTRFDGHEAFLPGSKTMLTKMTTAQTVSPKPVKLPLQSQRTTGTVPPSKL